MSKTIKTALQDEVQYPLKQGVYDNILISRQLNGDDEFSFEVSQSNSYRGAVADCYKRLILSPNITEGDISISYSDRNTMLKLANSIYDQIGEKPLDSFDRPTVTILN